MDKLIKLALLVALFFMGWGFFDLFRSFMFGLQAESNGAQMTADLVNSTLLSAVVKASIGGFIGSLVLAATRKK
ncbi:MAG: hypothetical protein HUJ80_02440 [Firmicutes bacterium]|nr:hypothetical protein [Bacillota bacterium]